MVRKKRGYGSGGSYGFGFPYGLSFFNAYDLAAMSISKTPTTLIRISIDSVTGQDQERENFLFSEKGKPLFTPEAEGATNLLLSDNFNRQNSTDPGTDWIETNPAIYEIASSKLKGTPVSDTILDKVIRRKLSDDFTDGVVSVDFNLVSTPIFADNVRVFARLQNSNDFQSGYMATISVSAGIFVLHKFIDGAQTQLEGEGISPAIVSGTDYKLSFSLIGNNLSAIVTNIGTSAIIGTIEATDSDITTKGSSGIMLGSTITGSVVNFDNFKVIKNVFSRPYLVKDVHLSQEISQSITLTGKMNLIFEDDKETSGHFWRKWRAKNKFYKNRIVEVLKGFDTLLESEYISVFKGVLQNISIGNSGNIEMSSKGLLKLTSRQFPAETDGVIGIDISSVATTITMTGDTDMSQYNSSGYLKLEPDSNNTTPEVVKYDSISGQEFIDVTRGEFQGDLWSSGSTHSSGSTVQQVEVYLNLNPIDVMIDLLSKTGLDDDQFFGDIDSGTGGTFLTIKEDWFNGRLVRGILDEPTEIKQYLKELRDITFTSLYQNENQKVALAYLIPARDETTLKTIDDTSNIIFRSSKINDNLDQQITRTITLFGLRGGKSGNDSADYKDRSVYIDAVRESQYNEKNTISFASRWLRKDLAGRRFSNQISSNRIRVFGDGIQTIEFDLETQDDDLQVGELFLLTTNKIQDKNGADLVNTKFFTTSKKQIGENRWSYSAYNARLTKRASFIAPTGTPDYSAASDDEKTYCFIGRTSDNKVDNSVEFEDGYYIV